MDACFSIHIRFRSHRHAPVERNLVCMAKELKTHVTATIYSAHKQLLLPSEQRKLNYIVQRLLAFLQL